MPDAQYMGGAPNPTVGWPRGFTVIELSRKCGFQFVQSVGLLEISGQDLSPKVHGFDWLLHPFVNIAFWEIVSTYFIECISTV